MSYNTRLVVVLAALAAALALGISGCAKKEAEAGIASIEAYNRRAPSQDAGYESAESIQTDAKAYNDDVAAAAQEIAPETERKLVTSAWLEIRLDDLEAGAAKLDALTRKHEAYASSVNVYENRRSCTLKIPAARLKAFLDEAKALGKIVSYAETTDDVTVRYFDLESRLETRRELLKTYQGYLGKAKNIEEILSVESRIADLQSEIDRTGGQFRALANLIDYSTVNLELLGPITASTYGKPTIGERVKGLLSGLGGYMGTVIVALLGFVVYGIPTLIILFILYWLLLGKIGLLKKLFKLVSGKKRGAKNNDAADS